MAYPTLVVQSGLFQGSRYHVYAPFRIGRHPDNDLQLTDKNISRFHAIIDPTEQGFRIRDLGSRNGTFVNGQRVSEAYVKEEEEIRIGSTRMAFMPEASDVDISSRGTGVIVLSPELLAQVRLRSAGEQPEIPPVPPPPTLPPDPAVHGHLARLHALYQANILLASETEQSGVFHRILEQLLQFLPADRGAILLLDPRNRQLGVAYSLTRPGEFPLGDVVVSREIAQRAIQDGVGVHVEDAQSDERFSLSDSVSGMDIRSVLCVPLIDRGETIGMIYLDALGRARAFREEDLQLLTAMAAPAAVQIRNIQFLERVEHAYLDTLSVLANAIEARDHYTVGHTWRVTRIALAMGDHLGYTPEQLRYVEMGGILHDVGKIAVEDAVLRKMGPLNPDEFEKMKLHPEHGARILKDVQFLKPVIPFVLFHQERWDGKGYPFQLKGEDVPREGRLLSVCDAFDAMTSHRPYRESRDPEAAVEELRRHRAKQFDPEMVDVFLEVWSKGRISSILQDYARGARSIPCPFCSTHIPLGESPREGVILECPVCSKSSLVMESAGEWKGELV